MHEMFSFTVEFDQDLDDWDVSNVTNMSGMFMNANKFDGKIGKWDVSNVKDMSFMFMGASEFNQDLSRWDVSNVTNMSGIKMNANKFDGNIGVSKKDNKNTRYNEERKVITVKQYINTFRKKGITYLQSLSKQDIEKIIKEGDELFHTNKKPIMTDNEYDIIREFLINKYPNTKIVQEVGFDIADEINTKAKVTLPYKMFSMNKIKPDTNTINTWKNKYTGPYVVSCKLDGVSGMYYSKNGVRKLYTRGNGTVGQDVSSLLSKIKNIPDIDNIVVRGEFIIPKKIFETKYSKEYANPRNMVAGVVNKNIADNRAIDVHFVAYEVIHPELTPANQMKELLKHKFETVKHQQYKEIDTTILSQHLQNWRDNYDYEIDGIIVTNDKIYPRKDGNPAHSFAFKMVISDQVVEAMVIDVVWTPSKHGILKPRVRINPVKIGGVTIEYATGFNAAYIVKNNIGIGAKIQLVRSGDVIPYIQKTIVPAVTPKMPDVKYSWNNTNVDILLDTDEIQNNSTVNQKIILNFFKKLGVEGVGEGNVKKIMNAGHTSIEEIALMSYNDFLAIDGFKTTMATKIHNGIKDRLENAKIETIMTASNEFGFSFGEIKLKSIMDAHPNILISNMSDSEKINIVASVPRISKDTATVFVDNIKHFKSFMNKIKMSHRYESTKKEQSKTNTGKEKENGKGKEINKPNESHPLYGKTVVMTGSRNKEIINILEKAGAKNGSSVSSKTFLVVSKNIDDATSKITKANELGIPIMSNDEFISLYA